MDSREILKISLISLAMGVALSFLYPNGTAWDLPWPIAFHFVVEIFYYTLIISLFDNSTELATHLYYAGGSFLFRIITSLVFAAAIATTTEVTLPMAFRLGIIGYIPQLYSVILVAPWILLSFINHGFSEPTIKVAGDANVIEPTRVQNSQEQRSLGSIIRTERADNVIQTGSAVSALDYVMDYSGVIGCLLTSAEGLLIDSRWNSKDEAENWAANAAELFLLNSKALKKTGDGELQNVQIWSLQKKIGIYAISGQLLTVVSLHSTDELLKVRISRAIEMLRNAGNKGQERKVTVRAR